MYNTCPICNANTHTVYYKELQQYKDASIVRCSNCSHLYSLLKKEVDTDALYSDEVYTVVENRDSVFDKIMNWEYNRVIRQIKRLRSSTGSLLDFGCGKGKFAWLAKNKNWKVKCIETSKSRAEYAKNIYQLDVDTAFYTSGNITENPFDVITLFHVMEHLPRPKDLIGSLAKSNLKTDGLLLIEVPNINSLQSKIAKEKWLHLDVPRHINHFTPDTVRAVADDLGFIPLKTGYFSFHLGVLGMLDSLLKIIGYKKNLILELKTRKSFPLLVKLVLLFPIAFILECFAAATKQGGVIRMFLKYK